MRKTALTINEPCGQNWDSMDPLAGGRFCGSCQKKVVDFSEMSDAAVMAYLNTASGPVCGRFYSDQVNRPLVVPRQRTSVIKWMHALLPALILLLKPGSGRAGLSQRGIPSTTQGTGAEAMAKESVNEPTPLSPNSVYTEVEEDTTGGRGSVMGDTNFIPVPVIGDTPRMKQMDTVVVTAYVTQRKMSMMMGAVSYVRSCDIKSVPLTKTPEQAMPSFSVYPNPAPAGALVTISLGDNLPVPETVQLYSVTGELVQSAANELDEESRVFNLHMPSSLAPGVYFIRLVHSPTKMTYAQKIIIR